MQARSKVEGRVTSLPVSTFCEIRRHVFGPVFVPLATGNKGSGWEVVAPQFLAEFSLPKAIRNNRFGVSPALDRRGE